MRIINNNATIALFDKMEALSEMAHESWRCIYLKPINANDTQNESHTAANAKAITELLSKTSGIIYLCEDGDIVIMVQRSPQAVLDKISAHLTEAEPGMPKKQPVYNLFGIFELGKHWDGLYNLCLNKYLKVIAHTEERHMGVVLGDRAEANIQEYLYPRIAVR